MLVGLSWFVSLLFRIGFNFVYLDSLGRKGLCERNNHLSERANAFVCRFRCGRPFCVRAGRWWCFFFSFCLKYVWLVALAGGHLHEINEWRLMYNQYKCIYVYINILVYMASTRHGVKCARNYKRSINVFFCNMQTGLRYERDYRWTWYEMLEKLRIERVETV